MIRYLQEELVNYLWVFSPPFEAIYACTRQHFYNIISGLKQVIPYIKSKMKVINLMHAFYHLLQQANLLLEVSNILHWKTLNQNGAFELINLQKKYK